MPVYLIRPARYAICLLLGGMQLLAHAQTDSTKARPKKELIYSANLDAGYRYGFIQGYTFDQSFPDQLFITEGNAGIKLLKLPFQLEYRYATMRVPYGLNNYFRLRFDAEKFTRDLQAKKEKLESLRKINVDSLLLKRQELTKKLYGYKHKIGELTSLNAGALKGLVPDSTLGNIQNMARLPGFNPADSLTLPALNVPGMPAYDASPLTDSLQQLAAGYNTMLHNIENMNAAIKQARALNTKIDSDALLQNAQAQAQQELDARRKKLFKLNAFELGTCFPANSYMLYGNLPVNGVFTDFEFNGMYMSFLYGEVVNNFLFANTFFERQLLSTQNVTNFFDFGNTNRGRKITAFKIGKGLFTGNHVHLGFLYGMGLKNYGDTTVVGDINLQPKETNAVVEITARYTIKAHQFEFAVARSVLEDYRSGKLWAGLGETNTYSLAGMMAYSTHFFKHRTRLRVMVKHLQPYFKSFGLGFVNSDYLRVNVKVDHRISKKITVGAFVKNDIDNLYNLVSLTNSIFNYGVNTGIRIGKSLSLRLTYNPILQRITGKDTGFNKTFKNYLYNANVSYNRRIRKTAIQSVLGYNYFNINDIAMTSNRFQNLVWNNSVQFRRLSVNLTSTYFTTNIIDSLGKNNLMHALNVMVPVKKIMLKAGLKHFSNLAGTTDYGAMAGCIIPLTRMLALNLEAQKFVMGDYFLYNNAVPENKTPWYGSATIQFRL